MLSSKSPMKPTSTAVASNGVRSRSKPLICLKCGEGKNIRYLYLVCGEFCNRTVGVDTAQPVLDKKNSAIVGRNLTFCLECAIKETCNNTNVAGFLTVRQYQNYKKHAKRSLQFREDGYIILQSHEWREWGLYKFNAKALKDVLEGSPACCKKKLPNGSERDARRMWADLDLNSVKKNWEDYSETNLCLDNIIHADVHYGERAVLNALMYAHEHDKISSLPRGAGTTVKPMHYAPLWRLAGIKEIQKVHGDSGPGNYHAVASFTADYEIIVHPGTHLLHESQEDAKNDKYYVTHTTQRWLKLQPGQLLVFHANIGHCGGRSSKKGKKGLEKRFKESDIDISWCGKETMPKLEVTDLAMHYGIENCLFHKSIESDYTSNAIEQLRVREETPWMYAGRKNKTVDNPKYGENEMELKKKLREAQINLNNHCKGKLKCQDHDYPEVLHFLDEANVTLKKYREQLRERFGDDFVSVPGPIKRKSGRVKRKRTF